MAEGGARRAGAVEKKPEQSLSASSGVSYRVVLQSIIVVGDDKMSRGWRKTA